MQSSTKIFIAGVGGQGSITSTLVVGEAATQAGLKVVSSEIHGMAQRGGVVTTTVVVGDARSAMIADGDADVLVGFEPIEALRAIRKANRDKTTVLMNVRPIIPIAVSLGRGTYPDIEAVESAIDQAAARRVSFDAVKLAAAVGTPKAAGSVMLGALAGLECLDIPPGVWIDALAERVPLRHRRANLEAFEAGLTQTASAAAVQDFVTTVGERARNLQAS